MGASNNLINAARKRNQTRMKSNQPLTPVEAYLKSQHSLAQQIDRAVANLQHAEESHRRIAEEHSRFFLRQTCLLDRLKEIVREPASFHSTGDLVARLKGLIEEFDEKPLRAARQEVSSGISSHQALDSEEDFEEKPYEIKVPDSIEITRHYHLKNSMQGDESRCKDPIEKELGSTLVKFQPTGLDNRAGTHNTTVLDPNQQTPKHRIDPSHSPPQEPSICDEWTGVDGLQLPNTFNQDRPTEPTKNLRYLLSSKKHSLLARSSSPGVAASSSISQNLHPNEQSGFTQNKKNAAASNRILQIDDSRNLKPQRSNSRPKKPFQFGSLFPNT